MPPISVPGRPSSPRTPPGPRSTGPRPARPLRIDLGSDPLAPNAPWGVDIDHTPASRSLADQQLGDLVDQAQAQLVVLRKTLDEAAASDRVVRQHVSELVQRIQQGHRFSAEIDQRIQAAGIAAGILEKAALTLRGLEQVVEQIRSSQTRLNDQIDARLAQQSETFAQRLAETDQRVERRFTELEARHAELISRADHAATRVQEKLDSTLHASEKTLEARADQLVATVDRHAAQAQARVSLILDGASDRLSVMEQQARSLGGRSFDQLETLCRQAIDVLGYDPRTAGPSPSPATGSLSHAVRAASEIIDDANQAGLRIGALQNGARAMIEELRELESKAAGTVQRAEPMRLELQTRIDAALDRAASAGQSLDRAVEAQAAALLQSQETSTRLARQRDDLGAIAAASEHHVTRARDAAGSLSAKIDTAGAESARLDAAMSDLRAQAEAIVAMAKRVAGLARPDQASQP